MNNFGSYKISNWAEQVSKSSTPAWKMLSYILFRRYWDWHSSVQLELDAVLPLDYIKVISERGYPVSFRRRWARERIDIKSANILVQGTGNGWDVISWAALRPKSIIAVDLYSFDSWKEIEQFCKTQFGVKVHFVSSPLEVDFGVTRGSIDLVASDAVYEHCKNLPAVMQETWRVLKLGGRVYANYGPLWYCAGGDHFSGRDTLLASYNHLLLNRDEYLEYVKNNRAEDEDCQSGARYIELELFSGLATHQYIEIYKAAGFCLMNLWLEASARAIRFKEKYPQEFLRVQSMLPDKYSFNDLLIKSHHLRMTKV